MTHTIESMIDTILKHEGGYVNDPDDRGGPTNFGITMATYSTYFDQAVVAADIENMDIDEAKEIYTNEYFLKPNINLLPELFQPVVFDMCVNHGAGGGIKILQRAYTHLFGLIAIDGGIGPITAGAIHALSKESQEALVNKACKVRAMKFHSMVARDETQGKFLNGWLIRAESFKV